MVKQAEDDLSDLLEDSPEEEPEPTPIEKIIKEEEPSEIVQPVQLTGRSIGGLPITKAGEATEFFNFMVYGDPGVGKTRLVGSANEVPEMCPVLALDFDGGILSLKRNYPDMDVVRLKNWNDFQKLYMALKKGDTGYRTLAVDSLTEAQKFSMQTIMQDVVKKDSERDQDVPGLREWGKNGEQLRRLVRLFRDLPVHTIFTAHVALQEDKKTQIVSKTPSLSGKMARECAGFIDTVGYMYKKVVKGEIERLMLTSGTDTVIAKDRSDRLPKIVRNPTMRDIYDAVFSS